MIATVLCLSVLPTVLCAFAFVYGLVFCIQSLINGEKMSESKHCRNMFLLAGGVLRCCCFCRTHGSIYTHPKRNWGAAIFGSQRPYVG